jgi:murein DD-endopeptidase MepM/ murein hydrolase activator NlpD
MEVNGLLDANVLAVNQLLFVPDPDNLGLPRESPPMTPHRDPAHPRRAPLNKEALLMWPLAQGVLLRDYAPHGALSSEGLLLATPAGTPVSAASEGKVLYVGDEGTRFGSMIILQHKEDLLTVYAHLDGVEVEKGQEVERGDVIGRVGSSGQAESPQLHFQVRRGRKTVDPLLFLPAP